MKCRHCGETIMLAPGETYYVHTRTMANICKMQRAEPEEPAVCQHDWANKAGSYYRGHPTEICILCGETR